jgi:hypothetical protein
MLRKEEQNSRGNFRLCNFGKNGEMYTLLTNNKKQNKKLIFLQTECEPARFRDADYIPMRRQLTVEEFTRLRFNIIIKMFGSGNKFCEKLGRADELT